MRTLGKKLADREYYLAHREEIKARVRQYHQDNREEVLHKMALRKVDHKALYVHRRAKFPEYAKVSKANQDAKSWQAPGKITAAQVRQLLEDQAGKCHYCQCDMGNKFSLDHVVPFCKGGNNYITNIVVACRRCNFRKHSTDYETFKGGTDAEITPMV